MKNQHINGGIFFACGFAAISAFSTTAAVPVLPPTVSIHNSSAGVSFAPLLSADGRRVVFTSEAADLAPGDSNGGRDVFLRDRQSGTTTVISRELGESTPGNGSSFAPDMTPDARYIVFQSAATNLVPIGTMPLSSNDLRTLIYRYDVQTEEMRLINVHRVQDLGPGSITNQYHRGSLTNFASDLVAPLISPDGQRVLFEVGRNGFAYNLDWAPYELFSQPRFDSVLLWNAQDGTTEWVSVWTQPSIFPPDMIAEASNFYAQYDNRPAMSSDGRFIAMARTSRNDGAESHNIPEVDKMNDKMNVMVRDRSGYTNILPFLSHDVAGENAEYSLVQGMSSSGEWLLYSKGPFLFGGDPNPLNNTQLWLRNLLTGEFNCVSTNSALGEIGNGISDQGAISADGNWIAFFSSSSNLVTGDLDTAADVFLYDRAGGAMTLISTLSEWMANDSQRPETPIVLTPDGRYILYQAIGSGLFRYDRVAGTNAVITTDVATDAPDISDDGRFVSFTALPSSIDPADPNPYRNAYVYDFETDLTELISVRDPAVQLSALLTGTALEVAGVSYDGRFIAFTGTLLGTDDRANANPLVWVRDLQLGTNILVSVDQNGDPLTDGDVFRDVQLSADGRWICFISTSTNLSTLDDTNRWSDVFVRDLENGITRLVSKNFAGDTSLELGGYAPELARDGSKVVFKVRYGTPAAYGTDTDLFEYDIATGINRLLTTKAGYPNSGLTYGRIADRHRLSLDGRVLVFRTEDAEFLPLPGIGFAENPYLLDLVSGDRAWLAGDSNGVSLLPYPGADAIIPGTDASRILVLSYPSATGRSVLMYDRALGYSVIVATNVQDVVGDANSAVAIQRFEGSLPQQPQVYRMDPSFAFEELMSVSTDGVTPGAGYSYPVDVSPDGRYVIFRTRSSNLSLLDDRNNFDLYLYDSAARVNILLSRSGVAGKSANGNSGKAVFTRDGTKIIFESFASDIIANDSNFDRDIFVAQISSSDSDNDTLPDDWEIAHFGNLDQSAATDFDIDGLNEAAELAAGTSPTNSSSVLRAIAVTSINEESATVLWSSIPGRRYQVQFRDGFEAQNWLNLGSDIIATGTSSQTLDDEFSGEGRRFYRVVLLN